jgi:hypothetical protein
MFDAILGDERRHEAYSRELLVELTGGEDAARRALRRAAALAAWRGWRRTGSAMGRAMYVVVMTVVFVLLAPFALAVRALQPARRGWQAPRSPR